MDADQARGGVREALAEVKDGGDAPLLKAAGLIERARAQLVAEAARNPNLHGPARRILPLLADALNVVTPQSASTATQEVQRD